MIFVADFDFENLERQFLDPKDIYFGFIEYHVDLYDGMILY